MNRSLIVLCVAGACANLADASLTLTIDTFTTSELKFTLSGTFDQDVIGDDTSLLGIKDNWSGNIGSNVDWINDGADLGIVVQNTIMIGGAVPARWLVAPSGQSWGDSIYFVNAGEAPILAGTSVTGTFHAQGDNLFSLVSTLELVSGFSNASGDWARLEARAVPAPSVIAMLGVCGLVSIRRKR